MQIRLRWISVAVLVLTVTMAPALLTRVVFPARALVGADRAPGQWGLTDAAEVWFQAADGVRLHGWWVVPPDTKPACATVVLFHGRSGHMGSRAPVAEWLAAAGYQVLLFDYRGYGASEPAAITEAGMLLDSLAAFDFARERAGNSAAITVLLGQSMGSALAAQVSALRPADVLVMVSPLRSVPQMLAARLPWMPAPLLDWQPLRFDAQAAVSQFGGDLVVAATGADTQVPITESAALFASAGAVRGKHWLEVEFPGHGGLLQSEAMREALLPVLAQLVSCGSTDQGVSE